MFKHILLLTDGSPLSATAIKEGTILPTTQSSGWVRRKAATSS